MLSVEETLLDRYAINRYSERHAALDCRECNEKILDLTDDDFITASVILDRIASHNDNYHYAMQFGRELHSQ